MRARTSLRLLFGFVLISMIGVTSWATSRQPVWEWGGLTQPPDNAWTIATLFDAYCGFVTFYVWVVYKEARWLPRVLWLIAILLLGNIAMSTYMLITLFKLPADARIAQVLIRQKN